MVRDRSEEMLQQRARGAFRGSLSFPSGNTGVSRNEVRMCFRVWDIVAIQCGKWTKEEVLLLLKNKRNAICPKGDSFTALHCPSERRDELIQILKEEFGKLIFFEGERGRYIAVRDKNHRLHFLLVRDDGECDFFMHYEYK